MRLSNNMLYDFGLLIIASYKRERQHIDPIITRNVIAYGFSPDQIVRAEKLRVWRGGNIELSKGFPRGSLFIPVRYIKDKGYVVSAIGRVLCRLKTRDFPFDIDHDFETEVFKETSPEDLAELFLEDIRTIENMLFDLKSRGDVWKDHIEKSDDPVKPAYIVIAKTEIIFSEDYGDDSSINWENVPVISKNLIRRIFRLSELPNDKAYIGALRPIRGLVCGSAVEFLLDIFKQKFVNSVNV